MLVTLGIGSMPSFLLLDACNMLPIDSLLVNGGMRGHFSRENSKPLIFNEVVKNDPIQVFVGTIPKGDFFIDSSGGVGCSSPCMDPCPEDVKKYRKGVLKGGIALHYSPSKTMSVRKGVPSFFLLGGWAKSNSQAIVSCSPFGIRLLETTNPSPNPRNVH